MAAKQQERTYIMVKPDGVQRGLVSEVIRRFEQRGYKLVALKMKSPDATLLEEHYADLKGKPFFPGLISYMTSGPVVCMVWEGTDVVKQGRRMLGETRPLESNPGKHPSRRLLHRRGPQHRPRLRQRRERQQGNQPLVYPRGDLRVDLCPAQVGVRAVNAAVLMRG
nr:nucleoside diphosphate kinase, putative [Toxoplasma gondii RH]